MSQRTCETPGCERKHVARGMCSFHYNKSRYTEDQRHPKRPAACCICGKTVMRRVDKAREGSYCCSVECRRIRQFGRRESRSSYDWNADAKRRAQSFGCAVVEDVDRLTVMQRDEWRCYLCGKDTSLVTDAFSPDSATVDHVVPLSKGGHHALSNVRCCCLACNASKANREAPSIAA